MVLITGGIKSGKSAYALEYAGKIEAPRAFIATGVAFDAEMEKRIVRHKEERNDDYILFEEPVEIFKPLREFQANVYLIDCMTTWLSNLFHYEKDVDGMVDEFVSSLTGKEVIITNEIGMGVIPVDKMVRGYVDRLGNLNKRLASIADEVYLMVSGIKTRIK